MGAVGNAATWAGKILKMDRRLVALKRKQHKAQLAVASKIRKRDDRIAQLERYLTGEASHDAQIHDKIHTRRGRSLTAGPSRSELRSSHSSFTPDVCPANSASSANSATLLSATSAKSTCSPTFHSATSAKPTCFRPELSRELT